MTTDWLEIEGVVVAGHRVASGTATNSPYPAGTIAMQTPVFQELGLDISGYYPATLNIAIAPYRFALKTPAYQFAQLRWTELCPPETFSFCDCQLRFQSEAYSGLVYYPHPETKVRHFQADALVEVLAPKITEITYGARVQIRFDAQQVSLTLGAA
ncbi:MAG: hypothetical protein HC873_00585 [Leptolyngbyaceae cyanobacterium SL_1_1]|nr:hypothetical protein [Leptolyngbyaceae cyanobacterium RM1_1_2]NJO08377.1 hypothetical protein [Leptolyngbyaceae cyanobacterium SL_1_1]